ncbi:response regulator [Candidatus Shapirobacteria bacterium CG10_big_fil_rev_8_21_14_0_10_48_15]|uniref:Response regulator n=1 Tax=Candidatus Shapirobacteria bacterium CG10_big_fil_rev_8_21_14_0_10_48_15 TaxID=1974484 RepID=A0A2M8L6Y1_9BACT|nr:MAG: response regulator [Candidatus Shapirobacteria bacterium CG10_big_fil_rev_8_21_14_0_10_48_15]
MSKKILIVEDEQYLRELYEEIIKDEGFAVDTAKDGWEGYSAMSKGGYDLVLLDIMLPKLDGLEILQKLKKAGLPKKANKKVVILTNLSKDLAIAHGLELGCDGYLIKSDLTPDQVIKSVKGFLE